MRADTVVGRLTHFKNLLVVLCAVCVGILLPGFALYTEPLVTPLVVLLVFSSLRDLRFDEIDPVAYGGLLTLSLLISYALLPLGGMRLASQFLSEGALIGVAIILAAPTTAGSAIIWTRLSGGDDQLSIVISVASLLVAPLAMPLVFQHLVSAHLATPVWPLLVDLAVIVGGGVLLTLVVPRRMVSERTASRGAAVAILLLIYSSVASLDLGSVRLDDLVPVLFVTLLLLGGGLALSLLAGYGMRLRRRTVLPLFFTSTLKNLGIALFVSLSYRSPMTVAAIVTYYILQQLVGAIIADVVPVRSRDRE
ncbi:bile acid:sodium symporter [Salinigranum rubrum]|nr:bile acid:sodium symporter [Salinigranum rubrum]